jgi:cyclic pyranopterin phosphate synthase
MNPLSHLDEQGRARMVDVGAKPPLLRIASAEATLHCRPETVALIRSGTAPKGDVLAVARVAGIQAAKRTDELIPLCHSLPLEQATVDFDLGEDRVGIRTSARTTAKTGVEMEALAAAAVAALTLYDMLKAADKTMRVDGLRVVSKEKIGGPVPPSGPGGEWACARSLRVGRLTLSDRASAGVYEDRSGPEIERVFREQWGGPCEFVARVLPDEREAIAAALRQLADEVGCDLILTTGGTGPSARDVTPEATREVIGKELCGLGEAMRAGSFAKVPTAILSRATAGVRGRSLIVNLPGNPKAIAECLPPILPAIRECLGHLMPAEN